MTELIFQKGLMLIKQIYQKNVIFATIDFKYEPYLCNGCHDLMQKVMGFNNIAIIYVNRNAYRIHFWYMSMVLTWLIKRVFYNFFYYI